MTLEIHTIAPIVESSAITLARYQALLDVECADQVGVRVVGRMLDAGPTSIENFTDDAFAIPGVLRAGIASQAAGARGILIDCMLDPGLAALRCALEIPVVGAAEIAFRLAATLGHAFGIVDIRDDTGPLVEQQVLSMGLQDRFAGVRGTGLHVAEAAASPDETFARIVEASRRIVCDNNADVIVLGCTEFSQHATALRQELLARKLNVPVINPTRLAIGTLVAIERSGVAHSKRAYPTPATRKTLRGYDLPQLYDRARD
ncbi:MAG TPA: aspartate/glutamate racemase family protein [Steroidobacter sp.]|uniref:aspartate/glutamate racemase family protein n=1 Tax=Steroidobacter sp. TaxID=1978227 RepID=UPI002ED79412